MKFNSRYSVTGISIHAPRRGSDTLKSMIFLRHKISIHAPRRGSDYLLILVARLRAISIHAPRRGSDSLFDACSASTHDFNPRSPQGERLYPPGAQRLITNISIHAPRRGSDSTAKAYSNDRIKRSTLREPHFLFSKNACFSPIFSMCATTSRTKNQRIRVSFGSYPGLAPTCFTLAWYRFPRL